MKVLRGFVGIIIGLVLSTSLWAAPAAKKLHKVVIYPDGTETAAQLRQQGVVKVDDYGAYWVAQVTDEQLTSLKHSRGKRVRQADNFDKVELNAATIDTTVGEPSLPSALQEQGTGGKRLRLVQFSGPILPEWLAMLKQAGVSKIINYVPNNAYLVAMNGATEAKLKAAQAAGGPIQWIGKYQPFYKMKPYLRETKLAQVDVWVAVLDGPDSASTVAAIQRIAVKQTGGVNHVMNQVNVLVTVHSSDLPALAQLPDVLWIDPVLTRKRMDVAQDLVIATGDTGVSPTNYLDFLLNTVGISTTPSDYPVVDIADSGLDGPNPNCNAPDGALLDVWSPIFYYGGGVVAPDVQCCLLPNAFQFSRVVYNDQADADGHGTIVASLLTGYETQPDETIHCTTEMHTNITKIVTNVCVYCSTDLSCVPANATILNCQPSTQTCTNSAGEAGLFIFCTYTVTTSSNVCTPVLDNKFPTPPPYCLLRGGYGLGVNPFGRIGASLGGAESGFTTPYNHALNAYLRAARISNNSWGEGLKVGENDGDYDALSQAYDALTRDAVLTGSTNPATPGASPVSQELLYVFAGGNANGVDGVGGFGDVLVTPPATAKNVITVGATTTAAPGALAPFTSFGPTEDGRFKPEIMAPGVGLAGWISTASYVHPDCGGCDPNNPSPAACDDGFSLRPIISQSYGPAGDPTGNGCFLQVNSGTSFAAPAVSGAAQLLWWYFQQRLVMLQPSPAMMKAYMCNSALYLPGSDPLTGVTDQLPSSAQGMGRLDLTRMFDGVPRVLRDESTPRAIDSPLLTTNPVVQQTFFSQSGQSYELNGTIADPTKPFRVTLAWTDPPGSPANFQQLVNDLNLQVTIGGHGYKGNVFNRNYSIPDSLLPADSINNMESVYLPAGQTGAWSIVIQAANIAGNAIPAMGAGLGQDFALVVYNATGASDVPNLATNDTCQTAALITTYPFSWTNNLVAGVYHNNQPSPSAGRGGDEEFFEIDYPTPGTAFSASSVGSANGLIPILSVWKGDCGALVEVTSARSNTNTFQSVVNWTVTDTNVYYIVAEGFQDRHGQLALNVTATPPPFGFNTSQVDFGTNHIGSATNITVSVSNLTGGSADISGESITGSNATDFTILVEDCLDKQLTNGSTCNLTLTFAPTVPGVRSATLNLFDNITGSPHTLSLIGFGVAPEPFYCSGSSGLTFGSTPVGFTTSSQAIIITNCGTADLFVTNVTMVGVAAGDFAVVTNTCSGNSIPPNGTCELDVAFTPSAAGARVATLVITDNTATSPHSLALYGTGIVPAPIICATPGSLGFGNVPVASTSSPLSVIVSNCGSAALTISGVSLTGLGSSQFTIANNSCIGGAIPVGGTCAIGVQMTPTVIGTATASLVINASAAGLQTIVPLTGNGTGSQPDASIATKNKIKSYIGNNVFTPAAPLSSQTLTQKGQKNKPRYFYVRCQNDGNAPDTFAVRGTGDLAGVFTVHYFLGAKNGLDVTAAVENGTFMTASLSPGAVTSDATLLQVAITQESTATTGTYPTVITFISASNSLKTDSVQAVITVK